LGSDAFTAVALFVASWAATAASLAQPAPTVSDADIARAQRVAPSVSDRDIEAAARRAAMPTEAELARVPVPAVPRIDALPAPQVRSPVDLQAIARGYASLQDTMPSIAHGPKLLVFISFAMPEAALDRLVGEAARCGATLVLRGLVEESLAKTVQRVNKLLGQRRAALQIDPQAFDRFAVTATPTLVLVRDGASLQSCQQTRCEITDAYVKAAGDVSLDYALAFFQRNAPAFAQEAAGLLQRLRN
jgi:conjugal transfer pilus assembly protein TrbC